MNTVDIETTHRNVRALTSAHNDRECIRKIERTLYWLAAYATPAAALRAARERAGLTPAALGAAIGETAEWVDALEAAPEEPEIETIWRVLEACGLNVTDADTLGLRVMRARRASFLSRGELAKRLGLLPSLAGLIAMLERGTWTPSEKDSPFNRALSAFLDAHATFIPARA